MAAFLMAGCSDNDDVIIDPDPVGGEEAILFSIGVSDGLTTKATTTDPLEGENVINNLTVLLFDSETGKYMDGIKETFNPGLEGTAQIEDWEIKSGKYDILLIANTGKNYDKNGTDKPADLTAMKSALADDVTTQTQSNLLMVSKLFDNVEIDYLTVGGLTARRTYFYMWEKTDSKGVAYTDKKSFSAIYNADNQVVLTRLASRIQLESIEIGFSEKENLAGASFRLDSVYLVNARPTTLLIPNGGVYEAKPETIKYYRGAPEKFDVIYGMIYPGSDESVKESFAKPYVGGKYTKTDGDKFIFTSEEDMFQVYAFENHKAYQYNEKDKVLYDTRLVICGEITLKDGQDLGQSYYHIPIRKEGVDGFQLVRNNIYVINVTLTGYGENRPDGSVTTPPPTEEEPEPKEEPVPETPNSNAKFDVSITVKPWNVINQYEEDPIPGN